MRSKIPAFAVGQSRQFDTKGKVSHNTMNTENFSEWHSGFRLIISCHLA